MHDIKSYIILYWGFLGKRCWRVLMTAWILAIVGIAIAMVWPDRFKASTQIYVDTDALLTQLLKESTISVEDKRDVDNIQSLLYARPSLRRVIKNANLDIDLGNARDEERLIDAMREDLEIDKITDDVYLISYYHTDRFIAQKVVQELLNNFVDVNLRALAKGSDRTISYARTRLEDIRSQTGKVQQEVVTFRSRHVEELQDRNFLLAELRKMDDAVESSPSKKRYLDTRIKQLSALLSTTPKNTKTAIRSGPSCSAAGLQDELSGLRARGLTDSHPDVRFIKSAISKRKAECARRGGSRVTYKTQNNPIYAQLADQLYELQLEREEIDSKTEASSKRAQKLRAILTRQPAALEQLEILEARKKSLLNELQNAELDYKKVKQTVDTNEKITLVDYRVIDPPLVPQNPEAPNRLALFLGAFVAAWAGSIGFHIATLQLKNNLPTAEALRQAFDLPVLGTIGDFSISMGQSRSKKIAWRLCVVAMVGVFAVLIWFYHIEGKRISLSSLWQSQQTSIQ